MNSKVCVNCHNKKPVNHTDNRLVTESCGHVKCMECLLLEKSGCIACLKEKQVEVEVEDCLEPEDKSEDNDSPAAPDETNAYSDAAVETELVEYDILSKKKRLEISHVIVETEENHKSYMCTVCKKRFTARSHVAYHAYCNGQQKPYECPECNKTFAAQSHYKYHMRVHRNERTYSCDVCGESFFQMSKLQRHKLKHTKEKKYACSQCNKAFNNISSLRKHGLTHTEERPYLCTICDRRFRDSSNFRKHMAKHDDKKYPCNGCASGGTECGTCASCEAESNRRARPHQCPRCPQAFHSNKDMRRHAAVHSDSKPFRCKVCSRRFRRKDNLERHIRNTHPDYVPATAVDCDVNALKQISTNGNLPTTTDNGQDNEKTKLEILNPLPPLPQEVIQKHMQTEVNENISQNNQEIETIDKTVEKIVEKVIDKSYILEANNARQSVIVVKNSCTDKKASNPECEYVHKIRKANSMATHRDIPLPPIDEKKIIELEQKASLNNLDIGAPPKDRNDLYKKILYERSEDVSSMTEEDKLHRSNSSPEMHWRRKMKLNINWSRPHGRPERVWEKTVQF